MIYFIKATRTGANHKVKLKSGFDTSRKVSSIIFERIFLMIKGTCPNYKPYF